MLAARAHCRHYCRTEKLLPNPQTQSRLQKHQNSPSFSASLPLACSRRTLSYPTKLRRSQRRIQHFPFRKQRPPTIQRCCRIPVKIYPHRGSPVRSQENDWGSDPKPAYAAAHRRRPKSSEEPIGAPSFRSNHASPDGCNLWMPLPTKAAGSRRLTSRPQITVQLLNQLCPPGLSSRRRSQYLSHQNPFQKLDRCLLPMLNFQSIRNSCSRDEEGCLDCSGKGAQTQTLSRRRLTARGLLLRESRW